MTTLLLKYKQLIGLEKVDNISDINKIYTISQFSNLSTQLNNKAQLESTFNDARIDKLKINNGVFNNVFINNLNCENLTVADINITNCNINNYTSINIITTNLYSDILTNTIFGNNIIINNNIINFYYNSSININLPYNVIMNYCVF